MGARLLDYYTRVASEFGIAGRMKLALLTAISSAKAATEADSPANLKKFEEALTRLRQPAP
jgi:hypothetical protein